MIFCLENHATSPSFIANVLNSNIGGTQSGIQDGISTEIQGEILTGSQVSTQAGNSQS